VLRWRKSSIALWNLSLEFLLLDSGDRTHVESSIGSGKCSLRTYFQARTLKHVFELDKCSSIVQLDLICPFIEIGYRLIDGKLDSVKSTILVDFGFVFVARIRARQLVNVFCSLKRGGFS
jgi:hypothetical protein